MKSTLPIFLLFGILTLSTGCDKEFCRDCAGFTYNVGTFDPTYPASQLDFRNAAGETISFILLRSEESNGSEVCQDGVNSERDIECSELSEAEYRSDDLGLDMVMSYTQRSRLTGNAEDQVVLFFSFKDTDQNSYVQTHALILEPEILLDNSAVILRDSVDLIDVRFFEALELRQDSTLLQDITTISPRGKFRSVVMKIDEGLLGFRDNNGIEYVKIN